MIAKGGSTTLQGWTAMNNSKQELGPEVLEDLASTLLERVFGASSLVQGKQGKKVETSMIFIRSLSNFSQWVEIKSNPLEGHRSLQIKGERKARM